MVRDILDVRPISLCDDTDGILPTLLPGCHIYIRLDIGLEPGKGGDREIMDSQDKETKSAHQIMASPGLPVPRSQLE